MGERQRHNGVGNLGHRGRAADIPHGLPDQGRTAELPSGVMPRLGGDEDGNAGPFPALECPRYRGNSGGGKPPPPTVPPMQHAVTTAGTELKAPFHSSVHQGSRAKEAAASGGGSEGELGEGL